MKYFSSECVANAYKGFQGSVTNKSWGVLAIMRQIDSMIIPGRTYVVNCSSLSTYIEQLFCLGSKKSYIDNGKEWFVKFSTQWNDFFDNQGQTIPNIYDIIVWAYRTSPLPDDITHEKLLAMFAEDFHLSVTDIQNTFETREKRIEYTNYLYTDSNLLSLVSGKLGTSLSKNITADGKSVAASPGELSRGPFIQPLYAALDTADYILVSQTNFDELYPMKACRNPIVTSINNDCFNHYLASIKTKPFLILGGFSGTGKSQKVKELAFLTCPNDDEFSKKLGNTENTPGNYCLVSVRPNWHDSTDLLGYYSSINDKYIVTDFVKFLVKAMQYPKIPFFVCLDEMNLAPVEEYFAEFLSVLESRKKVGDKILTDPLLSADWFNKKYKNYNIFDDIGLKRIGQEQSKGENRQASLFGVIDEAPFDRMDIVERLMENGLCLPQNVVVIGTVNMDDTTNSFSRKVIDRAMTFETVVEEFDNTYYESEDTMTYGGSKIGDCTWILPDEVRANEAIEHTPNLLNEDQKTEITNFINEVNTCLKGSPFQIAYRILNETILYYRATKIVNKGEDDLNKVFDDILMQKVLPRIEGDYDKTYKPLAALKTKAETKGWTKSKEKIDFMLGRFSQDDQGGFTSFWN